MRYIDTEPLLKEINHIEEEARKVRVSGTDKEAIGADGKVKLCLKLKFLIDSLRQEQNERHYTKVREIKTGKEFWAEYSTESAEWYEAGTGNAYSISDAEIVKEQQEELGKSMGEVAEEYSKRVSDGHNCRDLTCGFIAGAEWGAERFAKIARANLFEIGNNAQSQFERLYSEITGTKMYGGYND